MLVCFIERHARLQPDKPALVCRDATLTYSQLWSAVVQQSARLKRSPARAVVVRASQTAAFLQTYFAAHLAGKVVVPLEADIPQASLDAIEQTVSESHIPAEVADILFTTGTTGRQKGTMISHAAIIADAENLIEAQQFTPDLTFVVCGPLNHIGSLSKVWATMTVGATVHILEGIKQMNAFFDAVQAAPQKTATFLVPASIRMLLQFCPAQLVSVADKIDFIETGAAPLAQTDIDALCRLLPASRLYNTYASTETGIIATHNFADGCREAGCLGLPMRHSAIAFTDDGHIVCTGKTVMSGYVGDETLTAAVLRQGAVHTNDCGYLDSEGRLRLQGRDDAIINIGGYKVNPVEGEDSAKSFPTIADCICIADSHPVLGTALRLLVVTADNTPLDKKALGRHLLSALERYKVPQMYSQVAAINRTYNGKLDRKSYRQE